MTFCRQHPRKDAFDNAAVEHYGRFVNREITKDDLMLILRDMEDVHDLVGFLNWDFWCRDGYTLPWTRATNTPGEPGADTRQGGSR